MSQSGPDTAPLYHLHSYFRSSCSGRLRIACNLKQIPLSYSFINLVKGDQSSPDYAKINPSKSVPTLTPLSPEPGEDAAASRGHEFSITQSIAALEYLEEKYPDRRPLLPPLSDPIARAKVRTLVGIMASDLQPTTNLRILNRVRKLDGDAALWAKELMTEALLAYETVAKETAGKFSVGDEISLADVCLIPAVWGAQRWGVELDKMPVLMGAYERASEMEEVKRAHWNCQPDTPQDLRG